MFTSAQLVSTAASLFKQFETAVEKGDTVDFDFAVGAFFSLYRQTENQSLEKFSDLLSILNEYRFSLDNKNLVGEACIKDVKNELLKFFLDENFVSKNSTVPAPPKTPVAFRNIAQERAMDEEVTSVILGTNDVEFVESGLLAV
jgi:hypothetical protein